MSRTRKLLPIRYSAAGITAIAMVFVGLPAAHAADPSDAVAETVAEAAPAPAKVEKPVALGDGTLGAVTGDLFAQFPATSDQSVTIDDLAASDGKSVEIGLPLDAAKASVAKDGTVVYGNGSDVAVTVQATSSSVRMSTVLNGPDAPTRFAYPVTGAEVKLNASGGVDLYDDVTITGDDGQPVTERVVTMTAAKPWARDAAGRAVPTHYELSGNTVYQVVETNAKTQFPVVADPDWLKIAKCAAAVAYVVGTAAFLVGKSIAIVKAVAAAVTFVREVGGISAAAELIVGATTASEKAAFLAKARSIAGASILDFLGITQIKNNCF